MEVTLKVNKNSNFSMNGVRTFSKSVSRDSVTYTFSIDDDKFFSMMEGDHQCMDKLFSMVKGKSEKVMKMYNDLIDELENE